MLRHAFAALLALSLPGCDSKDAPNRIRVAYVTNGVDPFWDVAEAGALAGAREFNVDCEVHKPSGLEDQQRMIEGALARQVHGIAISPIDAENQVQFIDRACARTHVITQDSDAPKSKRLCFVGMDNYKAGRAAGRMVKEVLPGGGKVMIFVGRLEQLNARQRRQGVIDELLDRPDQTLDKVAFDPQDAKLEGGKYAIVGTRTDNFDRVRARENAEDALSAHKDLACMVGLFAYNMPDCIQAVKAAGKLGAIKLVSFDEQDATLQGIADGHVHGTVSQQPFKYGHHSVRILAGLARGDKSVLPPNGFLEVPIQEVRQANVKEFWAELRKLQGKGK